MLTDNWGVELLAATPFSHSVSTAGLGEVAKVKHLPPTLMAQYYFGDANSKVRPYVGAGINYTTFFDEEGRGALAGTDVSVDSSWGMAGQVLSLIHIYGRRLGRELQASNVGSSRAFLALSLIHI